MRIEAVGVLKASGVAGSSSNGLERWWCLRAGIAVLAFLLPSFITRRIETLHSQEGLWLHSVKISNHLVDRGSKALQHKMLPKCSRCHV